MTPFTYYIGVTKYDTKMTSFKMLLSLTVYGVITKMAFYVIAFNFYNPFIYENDQKRTEMVNIVEYFASLANDC